jgi:hypothetical protein
MMKLKLLIVFVLLALFASAAPPAHAQQTSPIAEPSLGTPPAPARRRIEINPRPLLYRRCVDWYELQHRPSGTVFYPQMRCWWVRG